METPKASADQQILPCINLKILIADEIFPLTETVSTIDAQSELANTIIVLAQALAKEGQTLHVNFLITLTTAWQEHFNDLLMRKLELPFPYYFAFLTREEEENNTYLLHAVIHQQPVT